MGDFDPCADCGHERWRHVPAQGGRAECCLRCTHTVPENDETEATKPWLHSFAEVQP